MYVSIFFQQTVSESLTHQESPNISILCDELTWFFFVGILIVAGWTFCWTFFQSPYNGIYFH